MEQSVLLLLSRSRYDDDVKDFCIQKIKILNRGFSFVAKTSGQINIVSLRLKACPLIKKFKVGLSQQPKVTSNI